MQIEIACRHGSVNEQLQEYVRTKSEKLLTFFERVTQILVTFDFNGDRVKVEILVDAEHKHNFVSHDEGNDSQHTFDQALSKMEQQVKKYKQKVQDHRRDIPLAELSESAQQAQNDDE